MVFGCWTSVSRKNVLPVFEENNGLLFYPVQYEGNESSKNVVYTGAAPNQQILPAVEWLMSKDGRREEEILPARVGLHLPAHGQPDHRQVPGVQGPHAGGREVHAAGPPGVPEHRPGHQEGRPGRDLQHDQRRQQRQLLQRAGGPGHHRGQDPGRGRQRRRGRAARPRPVQGQGPPRRVELLPEHRHPRQQGVRQAVQGEVRRRSRHRRPHRGGLLRRLLLEAGRREGRHHRRGQGARGHREAAAASSSTPPRARSSSTPRRSTPTSTSAWGRSATTSSSTSSTPRP